MAGGSGKRFWPLSRKNFPKQYLNITAQESMIEVTFNRLLPQIPKKNIFIVTTESQIHLVKKCLNGISDENIIIEPFGMNTAPAIGISMSYLAQKFPLNEVVLICGSDYEILDSKSFIDSLKDGYQSAKANNYVTFGVKPSYPATGYGYIEAGDRLDYGNKVINFKEKPDKETAALFLKSGNYYWNSGMFMWRLDSILNAYQKYLPKVFRLMEEVAQLLRIKNTSGASEAYSKMPKIPVDIGIMEQVERRVIIPVDYGWSDVGGWKALYDISQKDENQNVSNTKYYSIDSQNNFIRSNKYVALNGVENIAIVDTEDVLLVSNLEKTENVKNIVDSIETDNELKKFV